MKPINDTLLLPGTFLRLRVLLRVTMSTLPEPAGTFPRKTSLEPPGVRTVLETFFA